MTRRPGAATARGERTRRRPSDAPADCDEVTVSVVLPTYERGRVVGDAVESVLAQTHDDLELVVVDGGSTDRTPEVAESFADADPRVRYRRRETPAGVSAARNVGVRETDGEVVAFIDSDDRWREDKLRRQLAAMRERGPDCAVAYSPVEKAFGEPRTRPGESGDVEAAVRRMTVPTYTSTLLVERDALEAAGGFDESLQCFEDWDLCLRRAVDHEFACVADPLVEKGTAGDNASAEPDRLVDAVGRLREKHDLPDGTLARLLADAGVTLCEAGRLREARPYLRRALELNPRQPTTLAAYLLSLPGSPTAFDAGIERVYDLKRRLDA